MKCILIVITCFVFLSCDNGIGKNKGDTPAIVDSLQYVQQGDLKWTVTKRYMEDASNYYPYVITWSKRDSIIQYFVESKRKDSCLPIILTEILIKSNDLHLSFLLKNYNQKMPRFDQYFTGVDFKKSVTISVQTREQRISCKDSGVIGTNCANVYYYPKEVDSILRILLMK